MSCPRLLLALAAALLCAQAARASPPLHGVLRAVRPAAQPSSFPQPDLRGVAPVPEAEQRRAVLPPGFDRAVENALKGAAAVSASAPDAAGVVSPVAEELYNPWKGYVPPAESRMPRVAPFRPPPAAPAAANATATPAANATAPAPAEPAANATAPAANATAPAAAPAPEVEAAKKAEAEKKPAAAAEPAAKAATGERVAATDPSEPDDAEPGALPVKPTSRTASAVEARDASPAAAPATHGAALLAALVVAAAAAAGAAW